MYLPTAILLGADLVKRGAMVPTQRVLRLICLTFSFCAFAQAHQPFQSVDDVRITVGGLRCPFRRG